MSIRLNKALRELNIGLQTAVEFLESKKNLGEVKADLNFKLNDEQYKALESQFKQDAEVRSQAEKMISQKKPKEKKRAPEQNDANAEKPVKADGLRSLLLWARSILTVSARSLLQNLLLLKSIRRLRRKRLLPSAMSLPSLLQR